MIFCAGGMFALGASMSSDPQRTMKLAADITHTCHESYDRTGQLTVDCIDHCCYTSCVLAALH
jgi:hypothetical protein